LPKISELSEIARSQNQLLATLLAIFSKRLRCEWCCRNPNSTNYSELSSDGVVCYAPSTLIDTPNGPRTVESLRPGDLVLTVDLGPQPIR